VKQYNEYMSSNKGMSPSPIIGNQQNSSSNGYSMRGKVRMPQFERSNPHPQQRRNHLNDLSSIQHADGNAYEEFEGT